MNESLMIGYLLVNNATAKRDDVAPKSKPFEYGLFWRSVLLFGAVFVISIIAVTFVFLVS